MAGSVLSARIKSTATVLGEAAEISRRASASGLRKPGTPPYAFKDGSSMASRMLWVVQVGGWYKRNIQS